MNLALKTCILASGKSQISLAREIKISEPVLSKIVSGWIEPSLEIKKKIAAALNIPVEEIFSTEGAASEMASLLTGQAGEK